MTCCLMANTSMPRAAIRSCPLQHVQMITSCRRRASESIPFAPISSKPLQYFQVSIFRCCGTNVIFRPWKEISWQVVSIPANNTARRSRLLLLQKRAFLWGRAGCLHSQIHAATGGGSASSHCFVNYWRCCCCHPPQDLADRVTSLVVNDWLPPRQAVYLSI
jgi:hypothetical protein